MVEVVLSQKNLLAMSAHCPKKNQHNNRVSNTENDGQKLALQLENNGIKNS